MIIWILPLCSPRIIRSLNYKSIAVAKIHLLPRCIFDALKYDDVGTYAYYIVPKKKD